MTNKPVEWDRHAADRMRERGISRAEARWVLEQGIEDDADQHQHSDPVFAKRGTLANRREARVIYLENAERVYVISVMWTDEKRRK